MEYPYITYLILYPQRSIYTTNLKMIIFIQICISHVWHIDLKTFLPLPHNNNMNLLDYNEH